MSRWLIVPIFFCLTMPNRVQAQTLYDRHYPFRSSGQRDTVARYIAHILAPTLTCPALVQAGGRLGVLIKPTEQPVTPGKLTTKKGFKQTWQAFLQRSGVGSVMPLKVVSALPEGADIRLELKLPLRLARDVYDLRVMGLGINEIQPNAVRVHGQKEPERFRFAVVNDHQLWDPSWRLTGRAISAGKYPVPADAEENLAIAGQELHELALLDPDFVLLPGDLVYGVDYPREYSQARKLLKRARLPIFAVPGNHDGYADYVVKLRGGALTLVAGVLECKEHLEGELTWGKAWVFTTCLYGDIKDLLYADLHRDGLIYWSRQLGPPAYAFSHGGVRFVGLNTYDGTPERRHAFSLFMDAFDLKLGVPAVDNYGGYLSAKQLEFARREARGAARRGETLIFFGHHDPRGNEEGRAYHPNEAFPTDPLSMGGFEEWNYDSSEWDSDPRDGRKGETARRHSGIELLKILAWYGGYYFSGHVHHDERRIYQPGDMIGGIKVRRRLEFIRTTTASSGTTKGGYWGYRLVEVDGGKLKVVDYDPDHHLGSVPAGNLWATHQGTTPPEVSLASGLPRATRLVLPLELPARDEGYRFRLRRDKKSSGAMTPGEKMPQVLQLTRSAKKIRFSVEVFLPPAPYPPTERGLVRKVLRALPARGNRPPNPIIDATVAGQGALSVMDRPLKAHVGQTVLLSARRSTDPEGDRILTYYWDLAGEREALGPRVAHRFSGAGTFPVRLTVEDEAGARASLLRQVILAPPPGPGCGGCCTESGRPAPAATLLFLCLAGLAGGGFLLRRRRGR